jgi:hypothetical protein
MDSWEESRKYIEKTLERLEKGQHELGEKFDSMKEAGQEALLTIQNEIARLKERSTLWGALSGIVVSAAFALATYFIRKSS